MELNDKVVLKYRNVEIQVLLKGAELISFNVNNKEYMWDRNEQYWTKSSPVLFPFVGTLKNEKYEYNGNVYNMSTRHGFARDMDFILNNKGEDFLEFLLLSNDSTLEMYPFKFKFYIMYRIIESGIEINYKVVNESNDEMYFSIGAHPAFKLQIDEDIRLEDYYLEFEELETLERLSLDGALISTETELFLNNENKIYITNNLFEEDAIIFKNTKSNIVSIKCNKNSNKLMYDYTGFPYVAFWSPVKAPFVCIEPWYGISDYVNTNGKIEEKIGIEKLLSNDEFNAKMKVTVN